MDFLNFLTQMLGISPDYAVTQIIKDEDKKTIELHLKYIQNYYMIDNQRVAIYDTMPVRRWQHLDWFEYQTFIVCALPRYIDKDGNPKVVKTAFAPSGKKFTYLFANKVIDVLLATHSQKATSNILKTTPYIVRSIMEMAVELGLSKRKLSDIKHISIDEKAFQKGHTYATIVADASTNTILDMAENRDQAAIDSVFLDAEKHIKTHYRHIEIANMDMWRPYMSSIKYIAPKAMIVHDKFHLFAKLSDAIDKTRRVEVKTQSLLLRQRFTMLKNVESMSEKQLILFESINNANLKTAQAWHVRENFKAVFETPETKDEAKVIFNQWVEVSRSKKLAAVTRVVKTFVNHLEGILNAVITNTSSGKHENLNGRIQSILAKARGFINFERFRINMMFYYGGLDLRLTN